MSSADSPKANILKQIIDCTVADLQIKKKQVDEELLWRHARGMVTPAPFADALRRPDPEGLPKIIAELKKASPSKGLIRRDLQVVSLARELAAAGASALSVLTEPHFFQGSMRNLKLAADNVEIPVLRKDFIVDPYQILEARVYGASAVLLIMAALDLEQLKDLRLAAEEAGLDILLEVHSATELETALTVEPDIVGVNCRNLETFETDLEAAADLISKIPQGIVSVAESGIMNPADFKQIKETGADSCLIGEYLMKAESPGTVLRELAK
ncbi:MAG: indole-3-glycerol phosphate synthase TrpC [Lentisphaeria bacterium]